MTSIGAQPWAPRKQAEVVKTMGVLLIGATQTDQRPALDNEVLPADVQHLIASFSSEPLFVKNAVRIIEGIRAEGDRSGG